MTHPGSESAFPEPTESSSGSTPGASPAGGPGQGATAAGATRSGGMGLGAKLGILGGVVLLGGAGIWYASGNSGESAEPSAVATSPAETAGEDTEAEETAAEPEESPSQGPKPVEAGGRPALADMSFTERPLGISGITKDQEITGIDPLGPYLLGFDHWHGGPVAFRVEGTRAVPVELPLGPDDSVYSVYAGRIYMADGRTDGAPIRAWDPLTDDTKEFPNPTGGNLNSVAPVDDERIAAVVHIEDAKHIVLLDGEEVVWDVPVSTIYPPNDKVPELRIEGSWVIGGGGYDDLGAVNIDTGATISFAERRIIGAYPDGLVLGANFDTDEITAFDTEGNTVRSTRNSEYFHTAHLNHMVSFSDLVSALTKLEDRDLPPLNTDDTWGLYAVVPGGEVVAERITHEGYMTIGNEGFPCGYSSLFTGDRSRILCSSFSGIAAFDVPTGPLDRANQIEYEEKSAFTGAANDAERAQVLHYGAVPDWEIPTPSGVGRFFPFDKDKWLMEGGRLYLMR